MVETTTKNYGWVKPQVQGSSTTWGGFLNDDMDDIDALVFANQQGINPIGSGALWFTATPPTNWLICDGSSLSTTTYAALFAVIGYQYGGSGPNFNLPPTQNIFPIGAGASFPLASVGGEANHTLAYGEMPAHEHNVPDPGHPHSAYQNAHSHAIATGGHAHAIHTGAHAHTYTEWVSGIGSPVNANPVFYYAGAETAATSTVGDLGGNTDAAGNLGGNTDTQQPGVGVYAALTGITTTDVQGSGTPHNNIPPYLAINFIIRYQ
jgi:microcystin-dependent protein